MTYLILTLFLLILIMLILERYQLLKQIHRQRHLLHELHQCFDVQTEYLSGEFEKTRDHSPIMSYMDIKCAESEAQIKSIQDKMLVIETASAHGYSRMSDKLDAATEVMRAGLSSHYNTLNFTSQRISRMEELISAWAEEKIKNEAKKGEANRTLRRHLKDRLSHPVKRPHLKSARQASIYAALPHSFTRAEANVIATSQGYSIRALTSFLANRRVFAKIHEGKYQKVRHG